MKILYIFKRPVNSLLKEIGKGSLPADSVYGLFNVSKHEKAITSDTFFFQNKFVQTLQIPISKLAAAFTNVGFSLIPIILLYKKIKSVDLIFATLDTVGLPVLLLKYLGLVKQPVVYNTIGLETNLQIKKSKLIKSFYSKLIRQADVITSVASFDECKRLSKYLNISISKFIFCPFGVDSKFFSPSLEVEKDFILSVGADPRRDWNTLLKSSQYFKLPLKIVSAKGSLSNFQIPDNVEVMENLQIADLRTLIAKAKIIVLPLKQSSYFTGQTTFFQAMSMSKPVVITKIHPFVDYPKLVDGFNCSLCQPYNGKDLVNKVNDLILDNKKREQIGKNGRKFILSNYTVEKYSSRLLKIFRKFRINQNLSKNSLKE